MRLPVQAPTKFELVINLKRPMRSRSLFPHGSCRAPTRWSN